jgi:hypothetical protein
VEENARLVAELAASRSELARALSLVPSAKTSSNCISPALDAFTPIPTSSRLSFFASPGWETSSRVQRCVLANILNKGRNSALVIYTFDVWRMLMYCRVQHDLGQKEAHQQRLLHEREMAAYKKEERMLCSQSKPALAHQHDRRSEHMPCESSPALDAAKSSRIVTRFFSSRCVSDEVCGTPVGGGNNVCDETSLTELLDAGEQMLQTAERRVEELERDKSELQEELILAQAECARLMSLVEGKREGKEEHEQRDEARACEVSVVADTPRRISHQFALLDAQGCQGTRDWATWSKGRGASVVDAGSEDKENVANGWPQLYKPARVGKAWVKSTSTTSGGSRSFKAHSFSPMTLSSLASASPMEARGTSTMPKPLRTKVLTPRAL